MKGVVGQLRSQVRERARGLVLTLGGSLPMRRANFDVRLLYGHSIATADIPAFRRTLRFLRQHFEFVSNEEAVALLRDDQPPGGRYLALSFDDGFRDNYEILAPALHDHGATACFFLVSNFIGCTEDYRCKIVSERFRCALDRKPMSWQMVRELVSAGFEIGAHTADHFDLSELDPLDAERQMVDAKQAIEAACNRPCRLFAWPYGALRHFPTRLFPIAEREFDLIFSAVRSVRHLPSNSAIVNRDHFEPGWPLTHVRFFVRSPKARQATTRKLQPLG